jgi:hypothetical protein
MRYMRNGFWALLRIDENETRRFGRRLGEALACSEATGEDNIVSPKNSNAEAMPKQPRQAAH